MILHKVIKKLALLVIVATLGGCGGKIKYPTYYTLNLPSAPDPLAKEGLRCSIAVREFQAPSYLRQGPVVYRRIPEEIGFYEYHRWAEDPRTVVTNAVIDHLRANGEYSAVSMYNGHADNDFILSGKLEKLEEVDYDGGVKVEVELSAQLIRVKTGATIWSGAVSEVGRVSQRNMPGIVSQMNETMETAINKLLVGVPTPLASER